MADAMAVGTNLERVPETEVLVGEIDSTMSYLMLAARQAENLKPLTEEEADGMTVAQLGDRAALIFSHYKCTLMSERDFIMRFRVELNVLRRKTTQKGRRLPIPGCPTWGEVKKTYFRLSGRQIDALLADPKPDRKEPEPEPTEDREITVSDDQPETPTPSDEAVEKIHEAANEPDHPLPVTDAEVARIHEAAASNTTTDSDPRTEDMDETAAQSVAVVAAKLARMVAEGHGSGKAAKGLAKEIVEVDKEEPFLPTIITLESNLHVAIRAWKEFFNPEHPESESVKQRLMNQFVRAMSEDDFKLLCNSVIGRKKKEGKATLNAYSAALATQEEQSVSPEVPEASQEVERRKKITGYLQHTLDVISNDPEIDDGTKAAVLAKGREVLAKLDAKRAATA